MDAQTIIFGRLFADLTLFLVVVFWFTASAREMGRNPFLWFAMGAATLIFTTAVMRTFTIVALGEKRALELFAPENTAFLVSYNITAVGGAALAAWIVHRLFLTKPASISEKPHPVRYVLGLAISLVLLVIGTNWLMTAMFPPPGRVGVISYPVSIVAVLVGLGGSFVCAPGLLDRPEAGFVRRRTPFALPLSIFAAVASFWVAVHLYGEKPEQPDDPVLRMTPVPQNFEDFFKDR